VHSSRDSGTDLRLAVSLYPPDRFRSAPQHCGVFSDEIRRFWSGAREKGLRHSLLLPVRRFHLKRTTSGGCCMSNLAQSSHDVRDPRATPAHSDELLSTISPLPHQSFGYSAQTDYTEREPAECCQPCYPADRPAHWIARQFSAVVEWMMVSTAGLGL